MAYLIWEQLRSRSVVGGTGGSGRACGALHPSDEGACSGGISCSSGSWLREMALELCRQANHPAATAWDNVTAMLLQLQPPRRTPLARGRSMSRG